MSKLAIFFWLLLALYVYKLTFLQKELPDTHYKFSIARDKQGVPHIYGKEYEDILFALGYAEAQDRMWTLYFKKILMEGRTAQLFGSDLIPTDLEMRNIGYHEMGVQNLKHTDNQTIRLVQAYANGINAYANSVKMLPFEFYLFWLNWEDWTIENSLSSIYFISFALEFDWLYEIARQRLLETVGFDLATKVMHFGRNLFREVTIVNDEELKQHNKYAQYNYTEQLEVLKKHWLSKNMTLGSMKIPELIGGVEGQGSNGWVVGGEHTFHGKPILANDPHVVSLIPNLFYHFEVVRINDKNQTVSRKFGVMPDGIPTISLGVSDKICWGTTAAYIDNKDIYYETIRNNSGTMQYMFKDQWHNFRERKQIISVRGGQPVQEIFYHTHRGVVIEGITMDLHWKYGYPLPPKYTHNHTLSLVATHYRPDKSTLKGMLSLLLIESAADFVDVNREMLHPTVDTVFIYPNGSYGYAPVGGIPRRKIPEMGSFIKDGNSDQYDFLEEIPLEQKITVFDPKKGYFAMANNKFATNNYKHRSSIHQITTGRAYRLNNLIKNKIKKGDKFNFDTMKQMQLDQVDQFLCDVLPQFLTRLNQFKHIWANPKTEALAEKLVGWNCNMTATSVPASIYHVFETEHHYSLLTKAQLNEQERISIVTHAFFENYYFLLLQRFGQDKLQEGDRTICESSETAKYPNLHPCETSIALTFKKLPEQLKQQFNSENIQDYQWGVIHRQRFAIMPFSQVPLLNAFFGRSYKAGGNSRTLNVAIFTPPAHKYTSFASPAFRFITDMNKTIYSLQTGQTDRAFSSPHFDTFMGTNTYHEYVPCNPFKEGLPEGWTFTVEKL